MLKGVNLISKWAFEMRKGVRKRTILNFQWCKHLYSHETSTLGQIFQTISPDICTSAS